MPQVAFTSHLRKFFPGLDATTVAGTTVAEVIDELEKLHPGLAAYIVDERGALRKHVNIFVGESLIRDRQTLRETVAEGDTVFIMQALSGG